jgi:hypothetical protein
MILAKRTGSSRRSKFFKELKRILENRLGTNMRYEAHRTKYEEKKTQKTNPGLSE